MLSTYQYPQFAHSPPPTGGRGHHPVVVVGAGPVGLCAAIDLALQGIAVVVVDDDDTVSVGSRGVCYAKRTLEILDRLGVGEACVQKGVSWNIGRNFFQDQEVYHFNLQPTLDQKRPGMINLQQYYLEAYLIERAKHLPLIDLRFKNKVEHIDHDERLVTVNVRTPEGDYTLTCDWLVVADGAKSSIRRQLGLEVEGKVFTDRFLIADVVMQADFPAERWFWFDPPFHRGQSVLLHKQADNVWRIDFQLGWQADPEEEKKPEKVIPRIQAMLGADRPFALEWVSVYTFQCRRMKQFRHGRCFFVGDVAHQVSPFGARGANSGIQDTDNLSWKLAWVIKALAPERLLESYSQERVFAADENILNSTRSTDFITPKSAVSLCFRNAVLQLSQRYDFARSLVNSGRLSTPAYLVDSPLNTPDDAPFKGLMFPGAPMIDSSVVVDGKASWLLDWVGGQFTLILYRAQADESALVAVQKCLQAINLTLPIKMVVIAGKEHTVSIAPSSSAIFATDHRGNFTERYDAQEHTTYLIRPDQHVVARWRNLDPLKIRYALAKATAQTL